jgi:signal transduction histidine kinase
MAGTNVLEVLLIEDNEHDMHLIRRCFRRMARIQGSIDWASTLAEGLGLAAEKQHDVVLVDLDVRDSWGIGTLEKLRAAAPHLPVIVLTGTSVDGLALETLRSGAQDHLAKDDVSPPVLERTIEYAVERHRLLGMVTRSERMASIGQLSAGMAHELNSPLAQIRTELDELKDGLSGGTEPELLVPSVDRALERVENIRNTVEALYSFSSAQRGKQEVFEPGRAVRLARRLAENNLKHVAELEEHIDARMPAVHGDQGRFIQAVLDLLNHACDVARHRRGRLGRVWLRAHEQNGQAMVVVEDDGPPVPAAQRERLFEPFGASRGGTAQSRGLGLAAAREIVRELGGSLEVRAGRHGGAAFEVRVPAARAAEPAHQAEPALSHPAEGRARILWIDDDVHLLRAFQRRLRRDHDVDVCESADEALRRIEQGERWDVICCDLMMPHMSGREFEEVLARRYPDLAARIIFVTGGVFTEEERRFLEQTRQPRLLKPFDWDALLDAVDEVRSRALAA